MRASMQSGELKWLHAKGPLLAFAREEGEEVTAAILNVGDGVEEVSIPWSGHLATDVISGQQFAPVQDRLLLRIPGMECILLV